MILHFPISGECMCCGSHSLFTTTIPKGVKTSLLHYSNCQIWSRYPRLKVLVVWCLLFTSRWRSFHGLLPPLTQVCCPHPCPSSVCLMLSLMRGVPAQTSFHSTEGEHMLETEDRGEESEGNKSSPTGVDFVGLSWIPSLTSGTSCVCVFA